SDSQITYSPLAFMRWPGVAVTLTLTGATIHDHGGSGVSSSSSPLTSNASTAIQSRLARQTIRYHRPAKSYVGAVGCFSIVWLFSDQKVLCILGAEQTTQVAVPSSVGDDAGVEQPAADGDVYPQCESSIDQWIHPSP